MCWIGKRRRMMPPRTFWPRNNTPARWLPLIFGLLWLVAGRAWAAPPPPFVVNSEPDNARITIYSEYLPDPDNHYSLEDVVSGGLDHRFQPASRFVERLGLSNHDWWIRVSIHNELSDQQRFALVMAPRAYQDSQFYLPDGPPGTTRYRTPLPDESFVHRYPIQVLDLPLGQPQVFYWRINPHGELVYSLTLTTMQKALGDNPLYGVYWLLIGMLLAMSLYHLALALMRSAASHGYHALFGFCVVGLIVIGSGFLGHLDDLSSWNHPLRLTLLSGALFAACGAGRTFVDSRQHSPALHYILLVLGALALIQIPLLLILPSPAAMGLCCILVLLTAPCLIALGYQAWHREVPAGALFFFTSILVGVPVAILCLVTLGLLHTGLDVPLTLLLVFTVAGTLQTAGLRLQHQRRQRLKAEQLRNQAVAETVETTRRETLARMGHDARTPLSGILGMAELLDDTPLTPNQKECVSAIHNAGESLLKIINDVLEYSQLSTSGAEISHEALDVHELLVDAVDLFRERAEEKQVELITHVHTNVPARMEGDPGRLRQVLTNLIGAFIRQAQHGELIIDVSLEPTGQAGQVRFEFSGTALRAGTLHDLRENGARQDSSTLNLAIAEQLVEAMSGRCGHRDGHNQEPAYWFIVPLSALDDPAPDNPADRVPLLGRSMLVVDDSTTVTRVIRHLALSWGMRVTASNDPREALASLRTQANINEPYDVVLLDHQMPGMTGVQLAARIHEDPVITHSPVLIMLTGISSSPTDVDARNVSIHRVLTKPVSAPRLKQVLSEELGLQRPSAPRQRSESPDPGLQVLVVEDHKLSQKVIRGMLNKLGITPELAANGLEALHRATQKRYDLILMDCEMPEMDGFEATRRIRAHERENGLVAVPIVALTAHILREHRERSLASGMNAHIPKPVELNVLRDVLIRFTRRGQVEESGEET